MNNKIKIIFLIIIFSLGKIVASTGQTIFSVRHALSYVFNGSNMSRSISMISIIAAGCTLFVVSITRVPAIHRQFQTGLKRQISSLLLNNMSCNRKIFYFFLVNFNVVSGLFSAVGAYLGTITLVEVILNISDYEVQNIKIVTQLVAIFVAISSFAVYYSFNIQKAKQNAIKLIVNINSNNSNFFISRKFLNTFMISFLNVMSVPFIAYFLTKNALHTMPYLDTFLSNASFQWIAVFAAVTALVASLMTTVPAMHEYFSKNEMEDPHRESIHWATLRFSTYIAGIVDSGASGLGNFLGVVTISHDVFNMALYNNYVILIAIGCGISSTLLNLAFSIRQGFNEVINHRFQRELLFNP